MFLGLRTTIFWNIFILMVLAISLISLVVLRITEREIFKQRALSDEMIFASIESSLSHILMQTPDFMSFPDAKLELRNLFQHYAKKSICQHIFFVDNNNMVIAHSDRNQTGQHLVDKDIVQAINSNTLYKRVYQGTSGVGPHLTISSPIYFKGKRAGILKAVFPLQDVQHSIQKALKIIFIYILFDGAIIIVFGTFLLSHYLLKPINKLIRFTEDISEGNLDGTPLFLSNKNEIGKLSTALKNMSENLRQERIKIQDQFQALEAKNIQLQQAHKEIIQTEKLASAGRLAAGVAHEIGNPIGIILGYLHMLKVNNIDEKKRLDYLNRIETETERVNTIIRDLLDYAQPSSQEVQEINLNDIINDIYSLISIQNEFKNINPIFILADELPDIYANKKQIKQLIINLVFNAIDAMPNGGTLTFATRLDATAKEDVICLTISDTGEGIPIENQGKVFDPFFTTKEQGKGTGLGLSNVLRIVELLGSSISFNSIPGEGTTFTVRFAAISSSNQ